MCFLSSPGNRPDLNLEYIFEFETRCAPRFTRACWFTIVWIVLLKYDDEKYTQTTFNILNRVSDPISQATNLTFDHDFTFMALTFDNRSIHKPILVQ